jgi:gluconolactonase
MKIFTALIAIAGITVCNVNLNQCETTKDTGSETQVGIFERFDPALDDIISPDARAEIIADSLEWSEGPLWVEAHKMLLFSDVPANSIYKWTESNGKELYLKPSGFTGNDISPFREPGSNGLLLDGSGNLVLCQHGDRRISRMEAPIHSPAARFVSMADHFKGKKFTSPNDGVISSTGELYFTDPPYGLHKMDNDPLKEMPWNGVYKVKKDGTVILLTDSISKPNGIALFPGEKKLLVANSDPEKPFWYVWDINGDSLINGRIFFSPTPIDASMTGLPDGLKIDRKGNVIATGPGGIYFFNSEGKKLGMIRLEHPASNCALSPDEKTLFITNDMFVLRVKMKE